MRYNCEIIDQPDTGTSCLLQPMFDGWAGTAGIRLFPGTVYLGPSGRWNFQFGISTFGSLNTFTPLVINAAVAGIRLDSTPYRLGTVS